ncbi:conjugative relaxase domain protein (plasmid) [Chondrocystis sp. NIES-4102]|nr:conjugative relaxase domain protein [Chondrocystis sp. NIES-4102]
MVCSIGIPYHNFANYAEDNLLINIEEGKSYAITNHVIVSQINNNEFIKEDDGQQQLQSNENSRQRIAENSRWFGDGAQSLGLSGQINSLSYRNIYQGVDNNELPLRRKLKKQNPVPGRDLTFSAPKSVSLLGLVQENKQIIDAHNHSVNRALEYVEHNCIYTRIGTGKKSYQQTNNLVAAIFNHQDSRNLDPNLHSHCVIFNLTQGNDDKWRAMDNRELYRQRITIGLIYHHELGQKLTELGYSVNWNNNGTIELANFKPEHLQQFSSRRTEILEVAGVDSSAKIKAIACISTRNQKQYIKADDRKIIRASWIDKYSALNISSFNNDNKNIVEAKKTLENGQQYVSSTYLIDQTIKSLNTENKVYFSKHEILKKALMQSQGRFQLSLLQQTISQHPSLIETKAGKYTTFALQQNDKLYSNKDIRERHIDTYDYSHPQQTLRSNLNPSVLDLATLSFESEQFNLPSSSSKFQLLMIEDDPTSEHTDVKLINNNKGVVFKVIENYLQTNENQQTKTIILTDAKFDEEQITSSLRNELIKQKKLGDFPLRSVCLERKQIQKANYNQLKNYQVGNMIKFNRESKKFSNQHLYKILDIDENKRILILGNRFGKIMELPIDRYRDRQVYDVKRRELRVNDKLRFNHSQYFKGKQVLARQSFIISKIASKDKITIEMNGKKIIVKSSELLYAGYNYADTIKERCNAKINNCIYLSSANKPDYLLKEDIYNAATLTKNELTVYTSTSSLNQHQYSKSNTKLIQLSDNTNNISKRFMDNISSTNKNEPNIKELNDLVNENHQFSQLKLEPTQSSNSLIKPIDYHKSIEDTLFDIASSAKYIVLNEGQKCMKSVDKEPSANGGLLDKIIYNSPDGLIIEKDSQNLSIYYDGKTIEFDQDYKVKRQELNENQTRQLTQKTQTIKQQIIERDQAQNINQSLDLSR